MQRVSGDLPSGLIQSYPEIGIVISLRNRRLEVREEPARRALVLGCAVHPLRGCERNHAVARHEAQRRTRRLVHGSLRFHTGRI